MRDFFPDVFSSFRNFQHHFQFVMDVLRKIPEYKNRFPSIEQCPDLMKNNWEFSRDFVAQLFSVVGVVSADADDFHFVVDLCRG